VTYVNGMGALGCSGSCSGCDERGRCGVSGLRGLSGDSSAVKVEESVKGSSSFREFTAGKPGSYEIGFRVEAVPFNQKKTTYFDRATWERAMRQAGATNVTVTNVRFTGSTDPRTQNWADDALKYLTGQDADQGNLVADLHYIVSLDIADTGAGMNGLGAWPGWVIGVTVLAAIAGTIALINGLSGHNIIVELLEAIGKGVFKLAAGAAGGGLVIIAALALGALMLKKSGGKISTKWFSGG